jgi:predicted transcriptional regulator
MVYLYLKKNSVNVDSFYKTEFKEKSFNKRIKIFTDNGFLVKKNKNFLLSSRGKKYLEIIKIIQSIYRIKSSGQYG